MNEFVEAVMDVSDSEETITYTRIDNGLLSKIPEENRSKIERHLLWILRDHHIRFFRMSSFPYKDLTDYLESAGRGLFFAFCPYCNRTYLLSAGTSKARVNKNPSVCVYCADMGPYWKFTSSMTKVGKLTSLLDHFEARGQGKKRELGRVILEQSLVMIATVIEVFLRDIYAITLNMRYVKPGTSLVRRFYDDSRNDFANIGKAKAAFKKDLDIDLNKMLSKESRVLLEVLMAKRNTIVHNNGFVDETFIRQTGSSAVKVRIRKLGQAPELKEQVPVSRDELDLYLRMAEELFLVLGRKFRKEFENIVIDKLIAFVEEHEVTRRYV